MFTAAAAALALSASCGGGGTATSGPSSGGGGKTYLSPSLSAGGVRAAVTHSGGSPSITIHGGKLQPTTSIYTLPPVPTGWSDKSWVGPTDGVHTQFFRVVTDIDADDDDDYLVYGYWGGYGQGLSTVPKPFYWGKQVYTGNLGSLAGTATYTGGVAGTYTSAESGLYSGGQFTASLSITADFDQDKVAGTMTDFKLSTATATTPDNLRTDTETIRWVTSSISGRGFTARGPTGANWYGRFFGPSAGGAKPTGIAGYFEKETLNRGQDDAARLSGSFAATR